MTPTRRQTGVTVLLLALALSQQQGFTCVFSFSSGDVKVGASSQGVPPRYKKSPWTSASLAQEAKELSRTVRAILEVDCK